MTTYAYPLGKSLLVVVVITALLLLIPLAAMQVTNQVSWTGFDFLSAAALLLGAGSAIALVLRHVPGLMYRRLAIALIGLALATLWAELAVGLFH
jgi:hypothetical protein